MTDLAKLGATVARIERCLADHRLRPSEMDVRTLVKAYRTGQLVERDMSEAWVATLEQLRAMAPWGWPGVAIIEVALTAIKGDDDADG